MKPVRIALISLAALVVASATGLLVALNSSFQTWYVRRSLASRPDLHCTIGHIAVGLHHVAVSDLRWQRNGVTIVVPAADADLSVVAALLRRRYDLGKLVAKGWTVDVAAGVATLSPPAKAGVAGASPANAAPSARPTSFAGIFSHLEFPFDFSVGEVDLVGRLILPAKDGAATMHIAGGGLNASHPGKFEIGGEVAMADGAVNAVQLEGTVDVQMRSARSVAKIDGKFEGRATGAKLTQPVGLRATITAQRLAAGENYAVLVTGADRSLVKIDATLPADGGRSTGGWELDLRDADVAPFAMGRAIPSFVANGRGQLEVEPGLQDVHVVGTITSSVSRLETLDEKLADIGAVDLKADIDVARHGDAISIRKLDLALSVPPSGPGTARPSATEPTPVATARALQAFDFNPRTGAVQATDSTRELIAVQLQAVPLAWAKPFTQDLAVSGNDVRGEVVATPRSGGFTFKTKVPLTVNHLSIGRAGKLLIRDLSVSLSTSGDYTPHGWQAELSGLTARAGTSTVLLLDAKAGRLPGAEQPLKATGLLSVDLHALAAQPFAEGFSTITHGNGTVEFVASLGALKEFQAKVALKNLAAEPRAPAEALPAITATLRANVAADGVITLSVPLLLERAGKMSDAALSGTFKPTARGGSFDARLTSDRLVLEDARLLQTLIAPRAPSAEPPVGSPWAGYDGKVDIRLKRLVYTDAVELSDVVGVLRVTGGAILFERGQAGVATGGAAQGSAVLRFETAPASRFAFGADIALTDFDPGPLLLSANPQLPPTIEGKFTATARLSGYGTKLGAVPYGAGRYELTSRGGVFRGLPVNVGNLVENSSKLAAWLATAGNAITSLAGRKDYDEVPSRSKAASELARTLSAISYDQLSVVLARDDQLNTNIESLSLISPEVRLSATGQATHAAGQRCVNDSVALEYHIRVRGRAAELMKYLGVLDAKTDDLGYAACTIPVKVDGTLARLDTTELSNRLVALAVEKTGLTEKAVDWINRLRGKTQN